MQSRAATIITVTSQKLSSQVHPPKRVRAISHTNRSWDLSHGLSNFLEQRIFREAHIRSDTYVHCHAHKSQPLAPVLKNVKRVDTLHTIPITFFLIVSSELHLNHSKRVLPLMFSDNNCESVLCLPCVLHAMPSSYSMTSASG